MKITINANTDLSEELTHADFEEVLDWFRSNGIDPEKVPMHHAVVIHNDAATAKIDWWQMGDARRPGATKVIQFVPEGDHDYAHLEAPISHPLPDHLAELLIDIWKAAVEEQAQLAATFAAAQVRTQAGQ